MADLELVDTRTTRFRSCIYLVRQMRTHYLSPLPPKPLGALDRISTSIPALFGPSNTNNTKQRGKLQSSAAPHGRVTTRLAYHLRHIKKPARRLSTLRQSNPTGVLYFTAHISYRQLSPTERHPPRRRRRKPQASMLEQKLEKEFGSARTALYTFISTLLQRFMEARDREMALGFLVEAP